MDTGFGDKSVSLTKVLIKNFQAYQPQVVLPKVIHSPDVSLIIKLTNKTYIFNLLTFILQCYLLLIGQAVLMCMFSKCTVIYINTIVPIGCFYKS